MTSRILTNIQRQQLEEKSYPPVGQFRGKYTARKCAECGVMFYGKRCHKCDTDKKTFNRKLTPIAETWIVYELSAEEEQRREEVLQRSLAATRDE